jgi:deoxyribose-phosphate aldolase
MDPKIDTIVREVIASYRDETSRCRDGLCTDGNCIVHNSEGVLSIIQNGASRISAGIGVSERGTFSSDLARYIDHTLLKPEATLIDIRKLCDEAKQFHFASVCVNPSFVSFCARYLSGTDVKICTVVGFPLGATTTETKVAETEQALRSGALEIDMVMNIGMLKSGEYEYVKNDIFRVVRAAHQVGSIVKVIIETALLTDEEKIQACLLSKWAGADFVKTSTGFSTGGATAGDIRLMRMVVGSTMGVKASGGVRSREDAEEMVASGATRIGASASVKIVGGNGSDTSRGY